MRKFKAIFIIGVLLMGWLSGWLYCKEITIQDVNVDSNLTNFPALVFLNADADFHEARADGYDIRFTESDGQTLLPYERESWSGGGGSAATAHFWVKVPSILATGGATIYIYYGKADAADGEDAQNVWDANFKARYSMKDLTTSTIEDSTANNNDGTKKATNEPIEANGKISKAQDFDGTDDYINILHSTNFDIAGSNTRTFSAWIKVDSLTDYEVIMSKWTLGADGAGWQINFNQQIADPNKLQIWLRNSVGTDWNRIENTASFSSGTWYFVTVVIDGGNLKLYKNGVELAATTTGSALDASNTLPLQIGIRGSASIAMDGTMDEVRISHIARSAEWIKFEYFNVNEADNELTWGAEEVIFAIADALHGHSTDAIALTQLHNLLVANALHGHISDSITLSQIHNLLVESAEHSHLADLIALFQAHQLAVNDGLHSHLADSVDIISTILLSFQSILRANELLIGQLGYSPDQALRSALNTHKTIHTRIRRSS